MVLRYLTNKYGLEENCDPKNCVGNFSTCRIQYLKLRRVFKTFFPYVIVKELGKSADKTLGLAEARLRGLCKVWRGFLTSLIREKDMVAQVTLAVITSVSHRLMAHIYIKVLLPQGRSRDIIKIATPC